jgi:predicted  nucleic acid-binding Zn-ribbon protein
LQKKIDKLKARVSKREDSIQKEIAKRKEEHNANKKAVAVLQEKITLAVNVLTAHHVALQEIGP